MGDVKFPLLDGSGKIGADQVPDLSGSYLPVKSGATPQVSLALRSAPSGQPDSCVGLVIDKVSGSSYAQGVEYTYNGAELWASALDYQNADFVPVTCISPTLQGANTGDVLRVAPDGTMRYGPGVGTPSGQGCGFQIQSDQAAVVDLTAYPGYTPVGLRVKSNAAVNGVELWQLTAGSRRTALDFYGNSSVVGWKLIEDPTGSDIKCFVIYDKAAAINRVLLGVHPSIASSDTMAVTSAGPGKTPLVLIGATFQSGDLFTIYDPAVANKLVTVRNDGGIDVRGPSVPLRAYAAVGDTQPTYALGSTGMQQFGPGASSAPDVTFGRIAAGTVGTPYKFAIGGSATGFVDLDIFPTGADANIAVRTTSGTNFRITSSNTASTGATIQTLDAAPVAIKANGHNGLTVTTAGSALLAASAPATTATDGFPYLPANSGAPTGTPTAQAGYVPFYYDTTNHKVWIYDAGWKGVVVS